MNWEDLESLLESPEFNRLPLEMAWSADAKARWWEIQDLMGKYELELSIWTAAQHILMLFDTYGEAVGSVRVHLFIVRTSPAQNPNTTSDDNFTGHRLMINGKNCPPGVTTVELDRPGQFDFISVASRADGFKALEQAQSYLNTFTDKKRLPNPRTFSILATAFGKEFTSPSDVHSIIAEFAGTVRARMDELRLSRLADTLRPPGSTRPPSSRNL